MPCCSICGAEGTNKSTCPFNEDAKNPNPTKHNATPKSKAKPIATAKVKPVKPVKPIATTKPKPVKPSGPKAPVPTEDDDPETKYATAVAYAKKHIKDPKKQKEYVADVMGLMLPAVHIDATHPTEVRARENTKKQKKVQDMCELCMKAISLKDGPGKNKWESIATICEGCYGAIAEYHTVDPHMRSKYKRYHKGQLPLETLKQHAKRDGYFNATMYDGAKYWRDVALKHMIQDIPAPK